MKKGQGLSMNVIIVTAIALLVLVVLIAIFAGRMGNVSDELGAADAERNNKAEELGDLFSGNYEKKCELGPKDSNCATVLKNNKWEKTMGCTKCPALPPPTDGGEQTQKAFCCKAKK